ncbi:unnamed protein product [Mytilus edulis]|uniref:C-type lectin domain-containing protein n=1 Tax=Mytilus edulis TaxID=6550 RepID=A0A8S3TBU4_MYTED|nr:unnamed protein product [Mytilus edulis]
MTNQIRNLNPNDKTWVGLRFKNGDEWIWDNGSTGPINWDSDPVLPQLCIGVVGAWADNLNLGDMYDRFCFSRDGLICQTKTDTSGSCESDWTKIGSLCYKKLHESGSGVTYSEARILCTNENAKVMMPQSKNEAKLITTTLNCGLNCWVGLADFDADHIYTWEDGTEESQSNLYFGNNEPNHRNLDYICAYIENDTFFNRECTATENVICEIAAIDNLSTTTTVQFSTETERTLADITTMMKTSPFTTNPSTAATESTTLHYTTASGNPEMHTKDMPSTLQALTVSATQLTCINKCTTHSSSYVNGTAGAIMNMPYKVDVKSLSSYRRRHQSAPDSRMSSFYIGCVGSVILVMSFLLIIMLDFLPNA